MAAEWMAARRTYIINKTEGAAVSWPTLIKIPSRTECAEGFFAFSGEFWLGLFKTRTLPEI
jgi:hypothetical protein